MQFKDLKKRAIQIKDKYDHLNDVKKQRKWGVMERVMGLQTDLGELSEYVMVECGYRKGDNNKNKLKHELSDCLWAIFCIAEDMDVDLEKEFIKTMDELEEKIDKSLL